VCVCVGVVVRPSEFGGAGAGEDVVRCLFHHAAEIREWRG
jgi:hypothetical protein